MKCWAFAAACGRYRTGVINPRKSRLGIMASPCRPRAVLFGRHASEDITREDAEASIEAVRAIRAHVDRVIAAQIDELVPARQKA